MAKFYGKIGYSVTEETVPGVWTESITEREYRGDVIRNNRRLSPPNETLNDNIAISNEFSIIADAYAYQNFHLMKYVEWMGSKWKISNVDVQRPRLNLSIGGLYNEQET